MNCLYRACSQPILLINTLMKNPEALRKFWHKQQLHTSNSLGDMAFGVKIPGVGSFFLFQIIIFK